MKIDRQLGVGATSTVYSAIVTGDLPYASPGDRLAIKVLRATPDAQTMKRLMREVAIGQRIKSPYIVRYYDTGYINTGLERRPYIVLEQVIGKPFLEIIQQLRNNPGQRARARCLRILISLLEAMATLHQHNIVHRDVQPGNIIIRRGAGVLLDLGVSKYLNDDHSRTATWEEIGSRRYWAPEYVASSDRGMLRTSLKHSRSRWSHKGDIFMLGSTFIHALTGKRPFDDKKLYIDFYQALRNYGEMRRTSIPEIDLLPKWTWPEVAKIIYLMTARDARARPDAIQILRLIKQPPFKIKITTSSAKGFPLNKFLWMISSEHTYGDPWLLAKKVARLYKAKGENATLTVGDVARLGNFGGKGTVRSIAELAFWGLVSQIDESERIASIDYNLRPNLNEKVVLKVCKESVPIVEASIQHEQMHTHYRRIQNLLSMEWHERVHYRHCLNFDHIEFYGRHWTTDKCYCEKDAIVLRKLVDTRYGHQEIFIKGLRHIRRDTPDLQHLMSLQSGGSIHD